MNRNTPIESMAAEATAKPATLPDVSLPEVKPLSAEISGFLDTTSTTEKMGIFASPESFTAAMQMANALCKSTMIPREYQGKDNVANVIIALDVATRLNMPPFAVMQNLYIVNGRPSWSAQFIVAVINKSRRFNTPIQFEMSGEGDDRGCVAWVIDQEGNRLEGTRITIKMAKDEGWYSKSGSKWKTMPDQMLKYRAASFFGRAYCPDLIMGVYTEDESREMAPVVEKMIAPDPLED